MNKKKILIVEDEPEMRIMLVLELESAGYQVFQAEDGEVGFKLAQEAKPDLVISDVLMPKMDGNQLFKELRATDFGQNIPFIVLTARGKMRDYFETIEVDGFIEKPFEADDLLAKVKKVLKGMPLEKRTAKSKEKPKLEKAPEITISTEAESLIDAQAIEIKQPAADLQEKQKRQPTRKPKAGKPPPKKKILIVDDNKIVYRELQKTLLKHDCKIKVVNTPAKCLRELNRFFPDIIMSKFVLAEMNADIMANIIKEMPRFKDTPIIIYGDIGEEVDDDKSSEPDAKRFVLNAEGYDVLKKVTELLKK